MLSERQNLNEAERAWSIGITVPLLGAVAYLLLRGVTGHCAVYDYFGFASIGGRWPRRRPDLDSTGDERLDGTDEASALSFPASDPPAHGHVTG